MKRSKVVFVLSMTMVIFLASCRATAPTTAPSQDELLDKWRTAIGIYYMMAGICYTMSTETGTGRIGPDGQDMEPAIQVAILAYLDLADESFNTWDPPPPMKTYKDEGVASLDKIYGLYAQRSRQELTSDEFRGKISTECTSFMEKFAELLDAAGGDGLTLESMGEYMTGLSELLSGIGRD
jgi:hypothetical protein